MSSGCRSTRKWQTAMYSTGSAEWKTMNWCSSESPTVPCSLAKPGQPGGRDGDGRIDRQIRRRSPDHLSNTCRNAFAACPPDRVTVPHNRRRGCQVGAVITCEPAAETGCENRLADVGDRDRHTPSTTEDVGGIGRPRVTCPLNGEIMVTGSKPLRQRR